MTSHALDKAERLGWSRHDVEARLLDRHRERRRNAGQAGWQLFVGGLVVVYEHPDHGDPLRARIVTVWRSR